MVWHGPQRGYLENGEQASDFKIRRLTFCLPGMNLQAPPNHPDPIYAGFRSRPQDRGPPRGQHHRGGKLDLSTTPCVTPAACVGGIYAYMHPGMPMGSGVGPVRTEWEDYWGQGRPQLAPPPPPPSVTTPCISLSQHLVRSYLPTSLFHNQQSWKS